MVENSPFCSAVGRSIFVYGTLIHPHILARVLSGTLHTPGDEQDDGRNQFSHLQAVPAILSQYELRRVKGQEYPAIIEHSKVELPVRGIVVSGLTDNEVRRLDRFEGDEYVRISVNTLVPSSEEPISNEKRSQWDQKKIQGILDETLPPSRVQDLLSGQEPNLQVPVETYVWVASHGELELPDGPRGPWEFSTFSQSKSNRWTAGEWTDHGGPDGLEHSDEDNDRQGSETPATPLPGDSGGTRQGGFDEVRRALERAESSSSTSTFSMQTADDPWADPPRHDSARQTPSTANDGASNPWATSNIVNEPPQQEAWEAKPASSTSATKLERQHIPDGYPLEVEGQEVPGYERFGKPVRRWFFHESNPQRRFISFNNGASGSCPKPVMDSYIALSKKAEECVDAFERRFAPEAMLNLRTRVASMVNCPVRELVMIANTTTGTNAVLRGYPWGKDDYVIHFNTLYGAVLNTLQYVQDSNNLESPKRIVVDVTYPIAHDELVKRFTEVLQKSQAEGKRVKMAALEVITSRPGVKVPWERLVKVCRDHGVLSLIDGAHSFGQVPLDLGAVQPDFFVSTVHKWAYGHRSAALLHVPLRNQHLVPSCPTSWGYRSVAARSAKPPKEAGDDFLTQWAETGKMDYSAVLSLDAALDFRQRLGGEKRIQSYNHTLALLGGLRLCQILQVSLLETPSEPTLSANMVNLPLPLVNRAIGGSTQEIITKWLYEKGGETYIWNTLMDEFHTCVTIWPFQDQIMIRVSAEIWQDLEDWEYLGKALKEVCRRINSGEAEL
ncbi:unnamed protein product [Sympodiomycopsis kandeliae]